MGHATDDEGREGGGEHADGPPAPCHSRPPRRLTIEWAAEPVTGCDPTAPGRGDSVQSHADRHRPHGGRKLHPTRPHGGMDAAAIGARTV